MDVDQNASPFGLSLPLLNHLSVFLVDFFFFFLCSDDREYFAHTGSGLTGALLQDLVQEQSSRVRSHDVNSQETFISALTYDFFYSWKSN